MQLKVGSANPDAVFTAENPPTWPKRAPPMRKASAALLLSPPAVHESSGRRGELSHTHTNPFWSVPEPILWTPSVVSCDDGSSEQGSTPSVRNMVGRGGRGE